MYSYSLSFLIFFNRQPFAQYLNNTKAPDKGLNMLKMYKVYQRLTKTLCIVSTSHAEGRGFAGRVIPMIMTKWYKLPICLVHKH